MSFSELIAGFLLTDQQVAHFLYGDLCFQCPSDDECHFLPELKPEHLKALGELLLSKADEIELGAANVA